MNDAMLHFIKFPSSLSVGCRLLILCKIGKSALVNCRIYSSSHTLLCLIGGVVLGSGLKEQVGHVAEQIEELG